MRRLPIYFLIDVSESMVGEPIEQVQEGIARIMTELKTDPFALETTWISIIAFAGEAKVVTPLQDVITFYPPKIPIGSGTALSKGLAELMHAIDKDIVKTTYEVKGDWKPIVFFFTDGIPTDNCESTVNQWISKYKSKTNMVAISIGENTNYNLLGKLTDNVLLFNNNQHNSYKEFFKWVTASIKATSQNINNNSSDGINLTKADKTLVEKIDLTKNHQLPDENYVVINGMCSSNERLYLLKYKKAFEDSGFLDFQTRVFKLEGAYKIDAKTYKEYSSKDNQNSLKVQASEIYGNPSCPCCGNQIALATCSCGGVHCISGDGENKCPWCGQTSFYAAGDGDFGINRTLG